MGKLTINYMINHFKIFNEQKINHLPSIKVTSLRKCKVNDSSSELDSIIRQQSSVSREIVKSSVSETA